MVEISIGIVTYNSEKVIVRCLNSVFEQTFKDFEVIVVDNNSRDGTEKIVSEGFPQVTLIRNAENVGFGRGHNLAISMSKGEFYLALNHDMVLTKDYCPSLLAMMKNNPSVGSAMGKVLYMGKDGIRTDIVYSLGHLLRRNLCAVSPEDGENDGKNFVFPRRVFGVNAAAAMYRRQMLEEIKYSDGEYFDALYFMYGEDVDVDWRAWRCGWESWCYPSAVAYHIGGSAQNLQQRKMWIDGITNHMMTLMKNADFTDLLRVFPYYVINLSYKLVFQPASFYRILSNILINARGMLRKRGLIHAKQKAERRNLHVFLVGDSMILIVWREFREKMFGGKKALHSMSDL